MLNSNAAFQDEVSYTSAAMRQVSCHAYHIDNSRILLWHFYMTRDVLFAKELLDAVPGP